MNTLHDPELELFKRTIDLADYAKRAGYEARPQDGAPGLTVLDHPNRDRIVVGQHPNGPWIYASVPDYALRAPSEPAEQALARLRSAIHRSQDKGTIVEFVQQRDPWRTERTCRSTRCAIACAAFERPVCPSTSTAPSPHLRTRAVASGPSNGAALRYRRANRADPNRSSIVVATTGSACRERPTGDGSGAAAPGVA